MSDKKIRMQVAINGNVVDRDIELRDAGDGLLVMRPFTLELMIAGRATSAAVAALSVPAATWGTLHLEELLRALPGCTNCVSPATRRSITGAYLKCDACAKAVGLSAEYDLPYAPVVRDIQATIARVEAQRKG